ncbi:hypothetical protein SAMN02744133_109149 [Thalassospira xiamenensis M-5 = DSM 17429]|uniref:Lipoprotein n=1 Tax=Thalassospira xiamenensis M-5 = DSM 17429 TaxID=1123366 RepID=A0AB72UDY4_9PROT|nr:hypothetical protein [Thalassospira xiamenensis]AJD52510.1 hypothetical protein TH3_11970 [Thalassospira xiamenensis M-5 = DSM 17429]SIT23918.1 hypothetical protein SAMN02744133_109149 [Thalassospira xiamenensis M-5 = DSM 17429]
MISVLSPQAGVISMMSRRLGVAFMAVYVLAGCSLPDAGVSVEGDLKLLYGPFSLGNPPRYWHYADRPAKLDQGEQSKANSLYWDDIDGRIALAMRPAIAPFELGRRTNISVLASPYLSFDWLMNASALPGDTELVLGFRSQSQGDWGESDLGVGKPPIDHVIRLPIGGDISGTVGWQRDYFDLSTLHRRYWPDTDTVDVRLVWIGVASSHDQRPDVAGVTYLSHILLSR